MDPTQPEAKHVLATAIDAIVDSYGREGNINHLERDNLPSRSEVAQLLEDMLSILFPGYFVRDQVDDLTTRYFVGERCARVLRGLERAIARAQASALAPGAPCETEADPHALAVQVIRAIPSIREVLATDVSAALAGDPAARSEAEVIMSYPGIDAIAVHRIAHQMHQLCIPLLPRMMSEIVHSRTGIDIHPGATIGRSFFIDHGTGVVIGETTLIGEHVKLYQGVTLGALSTHNLTPEERVRKRHPTIEDRVTVYAGATILGGDTVIAEGATVGGNVWLTRSVPAGTTVVLAKPMLRFVTADGENDVEVK